MYLLLQPIIVFVYLLILVMGREVKVVMILDSLNVVVLT
jgi:hypothetical protein